jgi:prevent-host-death family protein
MPKRDLMVPVTEARERFKEILASMADRNVLLLRHGRPVAVLISPDRYNDLLDRVELLEGEIGVLAVKAGLDETVPWEKVKAEAGVKPKRRAAKHRVAR